MERLLNSGIVDANIIMPPECILNEYTITKEIQKFVFKSRNKIINILNKRDNRLLVVCGPGGVHSPEEVIDYMKLLKISADNYSDELMVVANLYFGTRNNSIWKGFLIDPEMIGSNQIISGIRQIRELLVEINEIGIPVGIEFDNPNTVIYFSDLVSWGVVNPTMHQDSTMLGVVSGLSFPVCFENISDVDVRIAINSIHKTKFSNSFVGLTGCGLFGLVDTVGNSHCHMSVPSKNSVPHYTTTSIEYADLLLRQKNLNQSIMVNLTQDIDEELDTESLTEFLSEVITLECRPLMGIMIHSNMYSGIQDDLSQLEYGVSVLDSCISIDQTIKIFSTLSTNLIKSNREEVDEEIQVLEPLTE